jgi:hypothetical protein
MDLREVASLLALVQGHDNRSFTEESVTIWHEALASIPFDYARAALVAHVAESADYVTPAAIAQGARAIRHRELEAARPPTQALELPSRFENDAARAARTHEGASLVQGVLDGMPSQEITEEDPIRLRALERRKRDQAMSRDDRRATSLGAAMAGVIGSLTVTSDPRPGVPCPRAGCACTHTEGCSGGWIDNPDRNGYESVRPCPTCRFPQANILKNTPNRQDAQRALREVGTGDATGGDQW